MSKKIFSKNVVNYAIISNHYIADFENEVIRNLVNKDNKLIYSVPYQHFTNAIEHYFSILKSKLQKLEGLTYNELKLNIKRYKKIFKK